MEIPGEPGMTSLCRAFLVMQADAGIFRSDRESCDAQRIPGGGKPGMTGFCRASFVVPASFVILANAGISPGGKDPPLHRGLDGARAQPSAQTR